MTMITRTVSRTLEILNAPIAQAPGFNIIYARWEGEKAFSWAVMTSKDAGALTGKMKDPQQVKAYSQLMPHSKARGNSWSKPKDFTGVLWLVSPVFIQNFRDRGYPFDRDYDDKGLVFETKTWGDMPPADFAPVLWCYYDHSLVDLQGRLITGRKDILVCSSSYRMNKIRELAAEQPERFQMADSEDHYVRGNGMSNTLMVSFTDEEYTRMKMEGGNLSNMFEVARFFGFDYKPLEADRRSDDDEDDD